MKRPIRCNQEGGQSFATANLQFLFIRGGLPAVELRIQDRSEQSALVVVSNLICCFPYLEVI
jgi:hypothetical protein